MEIVSDVASWYDHDTVIVVALVHVTSDGMFNVAMVGFVGVLTGAVTGTVLGGAVAPVSTVCPLAAVVAVAADVEVLDTLVDVLGDEREASPFPSSEHDVASNEITHTIASAAPVRTVLDLIVVSAASASSG